MHPKIFNDIKQHHFVTCGYTTFFLVEYFKYTSNNFFSLIDETLDIARKECQLL